jgi:hypothetical protein
VALAAAVVVVAASALRAGRALTGRFDPDEFQHLHGGWCLAHGLWPYRDYFEHHTPWFWLALAPVFCVFDVDRDPDRAVALVLAARGVMWVLGTVALYLTFRLGRTWASARTGWLAAALLGATLAFVDKSIEIRPDVPALVCLLGSWLATAAAFTRAPDDRGARWRLGLAGFLLGAALLFTQKAVFTVPATAALFLWWGADRQPPGSRRARMVGLAAFAAGLAVPVAGTLLLFAAHTGIATFVEFNLLRNAAWKARFSPVPYLRRIFDANAVVVGLALVGWMRGAARLPSTGPWREGGAFLVLQTAGLVAGAFILPVPWLHYYLMVLPLVAILAARTLAAVAEAVAGWRRAPTGALVPAAAAVLGLAIAVSAPLAAGFRTLRAGDPRMPDQLARLRLVLTSTTPSETVFDGFTGAGAFRPHAWFYFFLHDEVRAMLEGPELDRLRRALRDGEIAPALVLFDFDVQDLSPDVKAFVEDNYEPAGDPLVWRRKDLDVDGPVARGRIDLGPGPTAVLAGRGWGPAAEEGGHWLRPTQGRRSTVRVPLRRPADLDFVVRAQSDAATDARLRLVVNDRPCGEQALAPGLRDYAFRVPAAAWRAGVNRVRLDHEHALAVESLRVSAPPPSIP